MEKFANQSRKNIVNLEKRISRKNNDFFEKNRKMVFIKNPKICQMILRKNNGWLVVWGFIVQNLLRGMLRQEEK